MKGLTLIEIMVSILIFSIIALGLSSAVVAGKSALLVSDIPTELRQNVLFALMSMSRELRQADSKVVTITPGGLSDSVKFRIPHDNSVPPDGLVVNAAGDIEWSQDIIYSCNGGKLWRKLGAGVPTMIAPNIITLRFSQPDTELIKIDITAQKTGNTYPPDTESETVKMRNRS